MSVSVLASPSTSASSVAGPEPLVVRYYALALDRSGSLLLPTDSRTSAQPTIECMHSSSRPYEPISVSQISAENSTSTPPKASKAKPRRPKAPSSYAKAVTKEDVPEEGTIEWRAQNFDESQRAATERLIQQARDAAAKLAEESNNVGPNAASAASVAAANIASKVDSASSNVASAPMDAASFTAATAMRPLSKVSSVATKAASKAFAAFTKIASAVTDTTSSAAFASSSATE
ncbi:hypothetical protein CF327_g7409 [Tilletia walkeri]|uniref:Uncharacterized protein n=1 Tax=Tilletia walkeri TaxID=117179 RepID=A0A8X7N2T9_9BASI|nr:hypothetical protein CF327_g7409 [Tilletia walkeri]KAE8264017.1 hypothetical protein A4X09_0g7079 [Tilletia walkeri]